MIQLKWALGLLGGLSPRAWLIIGAVACFALWSGYCYRAGYSTADAEWEARAHAAKIARLERELAIQRATDAAEERLRAELDSENNQLRRVIETYVEELKSRPGKCLLGPDADRLQ